MASVWKQKGKRKYRFRYKNYRGEYVCGTGTTSKAQTRALAESLEGQHTLMRLGHLDPPAPPKEPLAFDEVAEEWLSWGAAQGGRRGGWSPGHLRNTRTRLEWWRTQLGLDTVEDLTGSLSGVEKGIRRMITEQRAPKTISNYVSSIQAFCRWCIDRDYLSDDPLRALRPVDTTPVTRRRAFTLEELQRLLASCHARRRPAYVLAVATGLRANELRSLEVRHVDLDDCCLRLEASWTKNRRAGRQEFPENLRSLLRQLVAGKSSTDRLLYVPTHTARDLDKDLATAQIEKATEEGKLDFHALRAAYVTGLSECGGSAVDLKALARHQSLAVTDLYAKPRRERLRALANVLGETLFGSILPSTGDPGCALSAHPSPQTEKQAATTPDAEEDCDDLAWWRERHWFRNDGQGPGAGLIDLPSGVDDDVRGVSPREHHRSRRH